MLLPDTLDRLRVGPPLTGLAQGALSVQGGLTIDSGGLTITAGQILAPDGSVGAPGLAYTSEAGAGWYRAGTQDVRHAQNNTDLVRLRLNTAVGLCIADVYPLTWGSSGIGSPDTMLFRDAANTLALRNGVNAQALRVYNTYTNATNYERGVLNWNTNIIEVGAENAGTGGARDVRLKSSVGAGIRFAANASDGWIINSAQSIYPSQAMSTTMTGGFSFIVSAAGAPTGVPAAGTGVPLYYDTTNQRLYAYNGSWRSVVLA